MSPTTVLGYCCGLCGGSIDFQGSKTQTQAQQIFTLGNARPVASTHETVIELEVMCLECGVINPDLTTLKSSPTRPMTVKDQNGNPVRSLPVDETELSPRQRRRLEKERKRQRDRALPDLLRIRDELNE